VGGSPGLTGVHRAGLAEALIAQLRQVNAEVLAVADQSREVKSLQKNNP
jgi:hypothetical protein